MANKFDDDEDVGEDVRVLNFQKLQEKPRLCLSILGDWAAIAANRNYLLYCPKDHLCFIDEQGKQHLSIKRNLAVCDICWSSHLDEFIILLDRNTKLYSLGITNNPAQELKQINVFREWMWSCTCYMDTLIVSSYGKGTYIEEYNMRNWTLINTMKPPGSDKHNQYIYKIRFNTDGSRLGIIQREGELHNWKYWFELRDRYDMKILQVIQLQCSCTALLSLPNQQFLASAWKDKILVLIDSAAQHSEVIRYDAAVDATALIGEKCLIIQTTKPSELRFYDL